MPCVAGSVVIHRVLRQFVSTVVGKGGVGKSSTANSLLNERVANVAALQSDVARPQAISRSVQGFTVTLIDTPGLLEADAVSDAVRQCLSMFTGIEMPI